MSFMSECKSDKQKTDARKLIGLIVVIMIIGLVLIYRDSQSQIRAKQEAELAMQRKEINYQEGIALIEQRKWHDAGIVLVDLRKGDYKDSSVLYNYANAQETFLKDGEIVGIEMANHYCLVIPDTYVGPFKDEIVLFKKDINQKKSAQDKVLEEARKIQPGSRKVRIGMTQDEAILSMGGKPYDINRTVGSYGTREQWCYKGGVYLYFDNGLLTTWQD